MGAHESNKGICQALVKAFKTLKCQTHLPIRVNQEIDSNNFSKKRSEEQEVCKQILERLHERKCSVQQ